MKMSPDLEAEIGKDVILACPATDGKGRSFWKIIVHRKEQGSQERVPIFLPDQFRVLVPEVSAEKREQSLKE